MRVTRCDRESPPRRITIPQQDRFWRSQFWSSDSLSGAMGDTHSRISPDGPVFGNRFERRAWSQLYDLLLWGLWWCTSSCRSVVVAKRKSKTASLLSKYFRKTDDCYGDLLLGREQTPPQRWPSTAIRVLPPPLVVPFEKQQQSSCAPEGSNQSQVTWTLHRFVQ